MAAPQVPRERPEQAGAGADDHCAPIAEPGYAADQAAVLRRLARIEGQVRGITRMVESDTYCIDVLTQIAAATRALQSVALQLLDDHMAHCLVAAVQSGGAEQEAKLAEAAAAIARLVRS